MSRLALEDGSSMPDPKEPALADAMWKARYAMHQLDQRELFRILAVAEAYQHLAAHPTSTTSVIKQLRQLRAKVRERRRAGRGT